MMEDYAQYALPEEERRRLLLSNLMMGLGAGLLDSRGKNVWPAISTGLLGGMQMGQQAIGTAQRGMVDSYKLKREIDADKERKALAAARAGARQKIGGLVAEVDPSKAFEIYNNAAKIAMEADDEKNAEFYSKLADKYRAKFSQTPQIGIDPTTGQPYQFVLDDQGNERRLSAGPKPDYKQVDTNKQVLFYDPLTQSQGGAFTKETDPNADLSAQVAREGHGITLRGQNMTDARARETNTVAATGKIADAVSGIRKEYNGLEQVKAYRSALPALQSAAQAPDTPAGDIDLIYAVGKTLDPNSVVREGELNLVIKSGSPLQKFQGYVNYISQGRGRLPPVQRRELVSMLQGRAAQLKAAHDTAAAPFVKQAQAMGLPLDQVFQQEAPAAPKTVVRTGTDKKTGRKVVQYSDGTIERQ